MNRTARNLLILFVLLSFASCRSSKELIYFIDTQEDEIIDTRPPEASEYHTIPGDILYISIKSMNPEINNLFNPEAGMEGQSSGSTSKYTTPEGAYLYGWEIDDQGNVNLPILGKVLVDGNTQEDIEKIVQQKADEFLKESIVKVKLLNYRVTVLGEVDQPGVYYNYSNSFSVLQAIAMANGNTDYANIKKVMVLRSTNKGYKSYKLDLSLRNSLKSEAFYLKPNDYVFVEPGKNKNVQLNAPAISIAISSLSFLLAVLAIIL